MAGQVKWANTKLDVLSFRVSAEMKELVHSAAGPGGMTEFLLDATTAKLVQMGELPGLESASDLDGAVPPEPLPTGPTAAASHGGDLELRLLRLEDTARETNAVVRLVAQRLGIPPAELLEADRERDGLTQWRERRP